MARNKYPEQTVERILAVSAKLFLEKGYENTSIQDILNELGDLTKGAIYHHFKSKEDIFDVVAEKMGQANQDIFTKVKNEKHLNGAQKLENLVRNHIFSEDTKKLIEIAPNLLDNPKLLSAQMKQIRDGIAVQLIAPIVEEGVEDGSIITDNPLELAEGIIILVNIWLNPLIFGNDPKKIPIQCKIVNGFLESYNIKLFDEETIKRLSQL